MAAMLVVIVRVVIVIAVMKIDSESCPPFVCKLILFYPIHFGLHCG